MLEILNPSELLYSFNVLSDTHITTDASHTYNKNFDRALKDILNANPDSRAIFITGDNTNYGYEEEWKEFKSIVDKNKNGLPNIYSTLGNHDLWKGETYDGLVDLFKQYTGATAPYYSVEIEGNTFIVLGSQSKADETGGYANLKADQIKWLKETLEKASASENAIFVFMHQPLKDTTSGTLTKIDPKIQSWHGVTQDSEIRKLFDKYPNLLFFTGHTHWKFDSIQPFLPGNGKGANYLNNASVAYLWNDADSESPGSQGYSVEVYKDYILVRGREISNGEWAANAQFLIPISKSANNDESNIAESVGSVSNGNSINESNVTTDNNSKDGYITWIIAGGVVLMVAVVLIIIKLKKLR
ncbi:MAG: metallophosphoesterase [Eubacteriales bacterium]|nr:metallophosphoesterase [Eubacteriales bacterium]MDD4474318.1 metallophosphoesterase [Eubacteriales bacterium]